ncbi:coiled-coil domain-containing protein 60-like [Clavelina lepadiformis]|uniref:coiled-coil domain-containing protein 60-like n=1 Tax=Clavelina lepadiformis TaxID=159417 RepID=UPI0040415704
MSPSIEDVRNYIVIKPVPAWKEATDSKLSARSLQNYALTLPTRYQVFKANYARRLQQMNTQGYSSASWKPYEEVGKPLYLSSKTLLQNSLGQMTDNAQKKDRLGEQSKKDTDKPHTEKATLKFGTNTASKQSTEPDSPPSKAKKAAKYISTASFLMKHRQHEDLQNIVKDLDEVRETMNCVKMGHALFPMLENEQNKRDNAFLVDKQNQLRDLKKGMQIQSVADDVIGEKEDEELKQRRPSSRQMSLRRAGSRASNITSISAVSAPSPAPGMVAQKAEVKKTLADQARPYTPVHSNINVSIESDNLHFGIWKQLCVLHWILEACKLEASGDSHHHKVMIPLSNCWDEKNPGGRTRDSRIVLQEKRNNSKWIKFTKNPSNKMPRSKSRRKITTYPSHQTGIRRNASYASELGSYQGESSARQRISRPPSARSVTLNIFQQLETQDQSIEDYTGEYVGLIRPSRPSSPGQSSIATTVVGGTVAGSDIGDDDNGTDVIDGSEAERRYPQEDFLNEKDYHEHLKKLLSTVKESVDNEMQKREKTAYVVAKVNNRLPMSVYDWSRSSYFKIGKKEVNISKIVVPAATPVTDYSEVKPVKNSLSTTRIRPHTAAVARRRDSIQNSVESGPVRPGSAFLASKPKPKRPMSSPAKLASQFTFKFSSEEKEKNLGQIREKFDEINDSKALQLHNQLTSLDMRRKKRMRVKFDTLSMTSSMQRDLRGMREAAIMTLKEEKESKKKRSNLITCDWYSTLTEHLPYDVHNDENCNVILEKLGMLGIEMAQSMYRVTPDAFLSALRGLRPWELCSPDVSGAVEFIRKHVAKMDEAEFDEWRNSRINQTDPIMGSDSKIK